MYDNDLLSDLGCLDHHRSAMRHDVIRLAFLPAALFLRWGDITIS
jgi:hypothetical protein